MVAFSISRRADRDIEGASDWYGRISASLAVAFLENVQRAIDVARTRPTSCPEARRGVRRVLCDRFPYHV
jgi:plasmid stabilization system protein ParE